MPLFDPAIFDPAIFDCGSPLPVPAHAGQQHQINKRLHRKKQSFLDDPEMLGLLRQYLEFKVTV